MPFVPLTWTSFRNTQASPEGNDLRKISGVSGAWDADAVSSEQIASASPGLGIQFGLWPLIVVAAGLSHDNPGASYEGVDYLIMAWGGDLPTTQIYENGILVYDTGFPPPTVAVYSIIINAAGQIEYWFDDVLKHTSLLAPSFPLFAVGKMSDVNIFYRIYDAMIDAGVVAKIDHLPLLGVH